MGKKNVKRRPRKKTKWYHKPLIWAITYIVLMFLYPIIYVVIPFKSFYHTTGKYEFELINESLEGYKVGIIKNIRESFILRYNSSRIKRNGLINDINYLNLLSLNFKTDESGAGYYVYLNFSMSIFSEEQTAIWDKIYANRNIDVTNTVFRAKIPMFNFDMSKDGNYIYGRIEEVLVTRTQHPDIVTDKYVEGIISDAFYQGNSNLAGYIRCNTEDFQRIGNAFDTYRGFPADYKYIRYLYYSMIVQTTLGLGDILPLTSTARIITIIQAILGVIIMGLFINALVSSMRIQ